MALSKFITKKGTVLVTKDADDKMIFHTPQKMSTKDLERFKKKHSEELKSIGKPDSKVL